MFEDGLGIMDCQYCIFYYFDNSNFVFYEFVKEKFKHVMPKFHIRYIKHKLLPNCIIPKLFHNFFTYIKCIKHDVIMVLKVD
jgi:hypothetical protein